MRKGNVVTGSNEDILGAEKPTAQHNAAPLLRAYVERVERLEAEIKGLNDDKRDTYAEMKGNGFDVKAVKAIVRLRKQDAGELAEQNAILELYKQALGMP